MEMQKKTTNDTKLNIVRVEPRTSRQAMRADEDMHGLDILRAFWYDGAVITSKELSRMNLSVCGQRGISASVPFHP